MYYIVLSQISQSVNRLPITSSHFTSEQNRNLNLYWIIPNVLLFVWFRLVSLSFISYSWRSIHFIRYFKSLLYTSLKILTKRKFLNTLLLDDNCDKVSFLKNGKKIFNLVFSIKKNVHLYFPAIYCLELYRTSSKKNF